MKYMELTIVSVIGGLVMTAVLVGAVVLVIASLGKQPSFVSWCDLSLMALVVLVFGTRLCMALELLSAADDADEEVTALVDGASAELSGLADQYSWLVSKDEADECISNTLNTVIDGSTYITDVVRRQAKRVIWRSIYWILGSFIILGGLAVVTGKQESQSVRPRAGGRSMQRSDRTSRSERYRRRR